MTTILNNVALDAKANVYFDGKCVSHSFTLADWESYLSYIASNCRWMLENRPDQRTGKTWRRKSLEYFLNVDVYAKTREGACDDL